jgi:hypothetical protein
MYDEREAKNHTCFAKNLQKKGAARWARLSGFRVKLPD